MTDRIDKLLTNARIAAELQAATLAITMFGLDRLPEVMARDDGDQAAGYEAEGGINPKGARS